MGARWSPVAALRRHSKRNEMDIFLANYLPRRIRRAAGDAAHCAKILSLGESGNNKLRAAWCEEFDDAASLPTKARPPPLITTRRAVLLLWAPNFSCREYLARIPYHSLGICLCEVRNDVFIVLARALSRREVTYLSRALGLSAGLLKSFLDSLPNAHWICVRARALESSLVVLLCAHF